MKLSELLSKPFKVKGGGTVNLKGLSKHIVDKEIEGGGCDFPYKYGYPFDFKYTFESKPSSGDVLLTLSEEQMTEINKTYGNIFTDNTMSIVKNSESGVSNFRQGASGGQYGAHIVIGAYRSGYIDLNSQGVMRYTEQGRGADVGDIVDLSTTVIITL